ncbi:hypothetical protein E2C01_095725 [Portunus trituberculatus]|uniref:Uncharacterized protein n=1 Tax=Portunus trituberculatus TaxID=210409 RepID=A0A5B7K6I1_PORTR|nr:hypothetical protein [Portunus trituberculatus]
MAGMTSCRYLRRRMTRVRSLARRTQCTQGRWCRR